jgi:hypothetical protein
VAACWAIAADGVVITIAPDAAIPIAAAVANNPILVINLPSHASPHSLRRNPRELLVMITTSLTATNRN